MGREAGGGVSEEEKEIVALIFDWIDDLGEGRVEVEFDNTLPDPEFADLLVAVRMVGP